MGLDKKRLGENVPDASSPSQRARERDEELKTLLASDLPMYFELLMIAYEKKLIKFVGLNYDRCYAEDIVQETFINVYKALMKRSAEEIVAMNIRSWLYTIVRNCALNHCQRYVKPPSISIDLQEGQDLLEETENGRYLSPDQEAEQKETYEELYLSIRCLPDHLRLPVMLHYIFELEYQEVAEVLQQPVNTVKSNGRRGLNKLRKMIKGER
jgi:RNA polymerase sigma-70 factor (ECF subfamily)